MLLAKTMLSQTFEVYGNWLANKLHFFFWRACQSTLDFSLNGWLFYTAKWWWEAARRSSSCIFEGTCNSVSIFTLSFSSWLNLYFYSRLCAFIYLGRWIYIQYHKCIRINWHVGSRHESLRTIRSFCSLENSSLMISFSVEHLGICCFPFSLFRECSNQIAML